MEARRMCPECPLQDHQVSEYKLMACWGELAKRHEEKARLLEEARTAEARCVPDAHPVATALAVCFDRHETGECPRVN